MRLFFIIYLFIYLLIYLAAQGLSCGTLDLHCSMLDLHCSMWDLHCDMWDLQLQHVGSSSLTRDSTRAPCIGSTESQPLDHQGSPQDYFLIPLSQYRHTIDFNILTQLSSRISLRVTQLNSCIRSRRFVPIVDSLGFSIQMIMPPANRGIYSSSFSIYVPSVSFSSLIELAKTSNTIELARAENLTFFLLLGKMCLVFHH